MKNKIAVVEANSCRRKIRDCTVTREKYLRARAQNDIPANYPPLLCQYEIHLKARCPPQSRSLRRSKFDHKTNALIVSVSKGFNPSLTEQNMYHPGCSDFPFPNSWAMSVDRRCYSAEIATDFEIADLFGNPTCCLPQSFYLYFMLMLIFCFISIKSCENRGDPTFAGWWEVILLAPKMLVNVAGQSFLARSWARNERVQFIINVAVPFEEYPPTGSDSLTSRFFVLARLLSAAV